MSADNDVHNTQAGGNVHSAHPDVMRVAACLKAAGLEPPAQTDVGSVRDYLERVSLFVAATSEPLTCELLVDFPVNGRLVPCKLYWPDSVDPAGLLFYCHGGGFRHGSLAGWDAPLRQLVRSSGVAVLSIEYALAPEYPFPTAFEEVLSIAQQVIEAQAIAGRTVSQFALGGDSAGANLALGAALSLRDQGVALRQLLLFYGVYSTDTSAPSWRRFGGFGGYGLSADSMRMYWHSYLSRGESDWRVQPLHAELQGLPRTRLVVGELDPLVDENIQLQRKLEAAGVDSSLVVLPGIIHGVLRFSELAGVVREIIENEAAVLSAALGQHL
ncbi:alpha/beta hydrolase fold domain-containing protein [Ectopseudomonas toyotomiensis]|uniref:Alpha/beta hydrolase fold domain-containing protein n=1 Tax=Ectopseudomonas toyotomiensis TaxID=554344 RepID=A0ABD7DYP6_9GAMM|nr:alpha/beta hydrolase fold domain-containing protein [Pseudomonas toyotomiensis]QSL92757.1 alpha/beta hydrolase fold domain-containing protein [Pseudomonas toyotomiensis]